MLAPGFGYFNAYDLLKKVKDLSVVFFTGDYLYEYKDGIYPNYNIAVRVEKVQTILSFCHLKTTTILGLFINVLLFC